MDKYRPRGPSLGVGKPRPKVKGPGPHFPWYPKPGGPDPLPEDERGPHVGDPEPF